MTLASILFSMALGALVGLSLGLTGGGGAIFAVPLLKYGLGLPILDAVGTSLITVGSTALIGSIQRARQRLVEYPTGLLFAVAGMLGAPIGTIIAEKISDSWLLLLFAALMLVIAGRMWITAKKASPDLPVLNLDQSGPTCRRSEDGRLRLNSRCALLIMLVGLTTGVITGLLGVGGGFIILPALVTFASMPMQKAIGTSLMIICLVSISGIFSHLLNGRDFSLTVTAPFAAGSVIGLFLGTNWSRRLQGPTLQRVFSLGIVLIVIFMLVQSF
jgi:uncharacterized membrane protein YfcA